MCRNIRTLFNYDPPSTAAPISKRRRCNMCARSAATGRLPPPTKPPSSRRSPISQPRQRPCSIRWRRRPRPAIGKPKSPKRAPATPAASGRHKPFTAPALALDYGGIGSAKRETAMALSGESMRAIIMDNIGKPRVLKVTRIRKPAPAPGQALVKVHADVREPLRSASAQRPPDHPQADAAYPRRRPGR